MSFVITWAGGAWYIAGPHGRDRILGDGRWVDEWLTAHDGTRQDLDFGGSKALEQRFVNDFGPIH